MTEEPPSRGNAPVPRPLDLGVEATFVGDTLVLVNRRKQLAIGVFMSMFWIGWIGWIGWVGGIAGFAHQEGGLPWMAIGHVLVAFALPFLFSTASASGKHWSCHFRAYASSGECS